MAAWIQIPCLVALRGEFDAVAPGRDKGADGSIGDSSHTSSSDHTPDEDSDVLRSRDADSDNETHAVDIDSTGPWPGDEGRPGNRAGGWFDRQILAIAERERAEYLSPTVFGRLQNIIWRGRIISRSWGWSEWRDYDGPSEHFDHAHLSARYLSRTEADTRPWGVKEEDDMTEAELVAAVTKALKGWTEENPDSATKEPFRVGGLLRMSEQRARNRHAALLAAITGVDVDEQAVAAAVLAGLPVAAIAAAIPAELAGQVVAEVLAKLPKASADELLARLAS